MTPAERDVVERLLEYPFEGHDDLRRQVENALVRPVDEGFSLEVRVNGPAVHSVPARVPVEAETRDSDGATVHVLLHVVDGRVNELELYREDLARVQAFPSAANLTVLRGDW